MTESAKRLQPNPKAFPAIILCGGRSRRMGRDKAFLPLGSQTVLQRVKNAFEGISSGLTLVIGRDAKQPRNSGFDQIIRDENPDLGPMEGLRVGLGSVESEYEMAMIGTCDAPLVVPEVYLYFLDQLNRNASCDAIMPCVDGHYYPLTAVFRTRALIPIRQMVDQQQLRVRDLLPKLNVLEVSESELGKLDPQQRTIRNINTREEYQRLLKEME